MVADDKDEEDEGGDEGDGGFTGGAVNAATLGTTRAISETAIRDVCQAVYMSGGDPSILMARPDVIRRVSEYMFGDTARIGTQQTETKESRNVAVGTVKVFITDFDVELVMTDNRLMKTMNHASDDDNDSAYILDPKLWDHGFLHSFRTEPLAKKGLSDRAQVAVDWTLKCYAEEGNGVIADIDATAPMVGCLRGRRVIPLGFAGNRSQRFTYMSPWPVGGSFRLLHGS